MKNKECYDLLNEQLKDISKVEIRSLSLAVLPRLMDVLHKNQPACNHCKRYSKEGEVYVHDISPLFGSDVKAKRSFENWVTETQHHLKENHQQRAKGRQSSFFAAIGMLIGVCTTSVYAWLTDSGNFLGMAGLGWAIGVVCGYILGKIKENTLSKNNKLY